MLRTTCHRRLLQRRHPQGQTRRALSPGRGAVAALPAPGIAVDAAGQLSLPENYGDGNPARLARGCPTTVAGTRGQGLYPTGSGLMRWQPVHERYYSSSILPGQHCGILTTVGGTDGVCL